MSICWDMRNSCDQDCPLGAEAVNFCKSKFQGCFALGKRTPSQQLSAEIKQCLSKSSARQPQYLCQPSYKPLVDVTGSAKDTVNQGNFMLLLMGNGCKQQWEQIKGLEGFWRSSSAEDVLYLQQPRGFGNGELELPRSSPAVEKTSSITLSRGPLSRILVKI